MPALLMPKLAEHMQEGTVAHWLRSEGEQVASGDELVEIETDKATMTLEAEADGVLHIVAEEGSVVAVGEPLATVGEPVPSSDVPANVALSATGRHTQVAAQGLDPGVLSEPSTVSPQRGESREGPPDGSNGDHPPGRLMASPVARRIAREHGLDLQAVPGSGRGGRVLRDDVLKAMASGLHAPQPASSSAIRVLKDGTGSTWLAGKGETRIKDLTRLQAIVAKRMTEARLSAPEFDLTARIDMTECLALRAHLKQLMDPAPSINDMIIKASAIALRENPRANGAYIDGHWEIFERVNVGVAVSAPGSLVVPTVFDADERSLSAIANDTRTLAAKVRDGTITPQELEGATFTVSNLGMYGVESFSAIINAPQAAILAIGAVAKEPVVGRDEQIVARDIMRATLVCDHRILYGADGATLLARLRELLEQPLLLLI